MHSFSRYCSRDADDISHSDVVNSGCFLPCAACSKPLLPIPQHFSTSASFHLTSVISTEQSLSDLPFHIFTVFFAVHPAPPFLTEAMSHFLREIKG